MNGVGVAGKEVLILDNAFGGIEIVVGPVWVNVSDRAIGVVRVDISWVAVIIVGAAKGIVAYGLSIVVIEVAADIISVADLVLKL